MNSGNSGISISGGTVNAGAMAAGDHARATNTSVAPATSIDQLRVQMADLIRELRAHQHELSDGAQAVAIAETAEREAAKERPDGASFLRMMRNLAAGVGSVASLATAVTALEHAATVLF